MGSEIVAFVVGPEPSAAADIVARKSSDLGRRKWTRMIGFQRLQSSVSLCWVKIAQCEGRPVPRRHLGARPSMTQATPR